MGRTWDGNRKASLWTSYVYSNNVFERERKERLWFAQVKVIEKEAGRTILWLGRRKKIAESLLKSQPVACSFDEKNVTREQL